MQASSLYEVPPTDPEAIAAQAGATLFGLDLEAFQARMTADDVDPADYDDDKYLPAPIGDPITTELAARVPYEMHRRLAHVTALTDRLPGAPVIRVPFLADDVHDLAGLIEVGRWLFDDGGAGDAGAGAGAGAGA